MHSRPMARSLGARLMSEFWRGLSYPPIVIAEIAASYLAIPQLADVRLDGSRVGDPGASVIVLGAWLFLALLWGLWRALQRRELSVQGALERLRQTKSEVAVDLGDNAPEVADFTDELCGLLVSAGWGAPRRGTWLAVDPPVRGIEIYYSPETEGAPYETLADVLREMGYVVSTTVANDDLKVVHEDQAKVMVGLGFRK